MRESGLVCESLIVSRIACQPGLLEAHRQCRSEALQTLGRSLDQYVRREPHLLNRSKQWFFKEPRAMWWVPELRAMGALNYVHVVRDIRSFHTPHIELHPTLWLSYFGGQRGFASAIGAALSLVQKLHGTRAMLTACVEFYLPGRPLVTINRTTWVAQTARGPTAAAQVLGNELAALAGRSKVSWLGFLVGWSHVHLRLSRARLPWLYLLRAE
eukprot:809850-Prymnesium_polylepis.1